MMQAPSDEARPNIVVFGAAGCGKSSLIDTLLSALNASKLRVAGEQGQTLDFTRYDNILFQAGDAPTPFTVSDTAGLRKDDSVLGAARNILKGRYRNNSRMDNGWRSVKAIAHDTKRAHGVVLVADATSNAHASVAGFVAEMCGEEDDLPCAVAWTRADEVEVGVLQDKVRAMLLAFPLAVNFPVRTYREDGDALNPRVDVAVLECFAYLGRQAARHMRHSAFEAALKLPPLPPLADAPP